MKNGTNSIIENIRKLMKNEGIWDYTVNTKIYTTQEFVDNFGTNMSNELKSLLRDNISKIQYYFDERILEPKIKLL